MPRVVHFEIPADDPDRAVEFYRQALGWKIDKWGPMNYWLVTTGDPSEPGINGAIMERSGVNCVRNTVSVSTVTGFMQKVREAGGKVLTDRMPIQGIGYWAICMDTEGNTFGIMEEDPTAH